MAKLNILIVDDAAFIRDLVKKVVREIYPSCELFEAVDGCKAIGVMNSKEIHVILCDWEMPEASGLDVLQWMRADERYKSTPFMMITSRGERDHVIKAVQAGVSEYIGKPFSRDSLSNKLTKLVWKHLRVKPEAANDIVDPRAASAADAFGAQVVDHKPKGGDFGGASVLMGASAKKVAQTTGSQSQPIESKVVAPKVSSKSNARAKGLADVRFASGSQAKLVIKDISLQELIGVFRREGALPVLLEQAVLDIVDQESGSVARINAYVRMMQAQEPSPDAQTIQMVLRYVDDDPEKLETLSRFIAKVR